jgi:WhiB family redox-sensing transcriptional regulator
MAVIEPMLVNRPRAPRWMARAACKGRTHLFFAPQAERPQARARRETKARLMCLECPVSDECRAFARRHREYGFWGGESEEERHLAGFTVAAPIGVRARDPLEPARHPLGLGHPSV